MSDVSANAHHVEFPRDEWGFTAPLRKAGLAAAGSVRGDDKKFELFLETMSIIIQHAQARLVSDKVGLQERLAEIAKAPHRVTVPGIPEGE